MFTVAETRDKLAHLAHSVQDRYAGDEDRPLAGYALTMAAYGTVVGALAGTARLTGRDVPDRVPVTDVALGALAIEKLSRLLAKDPVTSPLRAPFVKYKGNAGPAEVREEVRDHGGAKHVVGEMTSCPFCLDQWVATGFVAGSILAPRATRIVATTFATVAVSDALQFGYAALERSAG
jgi:hypothetical protein